MFDDGRSWIWLHECEHSLAEGKLSMTTVGGTDFWQRTYYGFRHDNGHCLLTSCTQDFSISVRCTFEPLSRFDQCGLMVRIDGENWIKVSIEYEKETLARLGSAVTNLGYSDWASVDIDAEVHRMWYRVQSRGADFLVEYSENGVVWRQMRIAHLHAFSDSVWAGLYACSPAEGGSFQPIFDHLTVGLSAWD